MPTYLPRYYRDAQELLDVSNCHYIIAIPSIVLEQIDAKGKKYVVQ